MAAELRKPTEQDVLELASNMRPEDALETFRSSGQDRLAVLRAALAMDGESWALLIDGELAGIWGVAKNPRQSLLGERIGLAWLLTTPLVERRSKAFWKACTEVLPQLFGHWDVLINYIDAEHEKAIRWAKRLGFVIGEPETFGALGAKFRGFVVRRENLRV